MRRFPESVYRTEENLFFLLAGLRSLRELCRVLEDCFEGFNFLPSRIIIKHIYICAYVYVCVHIYIYLYRFPLRASSYISELQFQMIQQYFWK